jgi:hypothetical protein
MTETDTPITEAVVVETTETVSKPKDVSREPVIRDSNDAIKQLRKENERLRKTLDETSAARAEEIANKKLEELRIEVETKANTAARQLLEERLTEIDTFNKARLIKMALRAEAQKAGVVDFDDLYVVMKPKLETVAFDADGDVSNAVDLIAEFKVNKPHLFAGMSTASTAKAPPDRFSNKIDYRSISDAEFTETLRKMGVNIPK